VTRYLAEAGIRSQGKTQWQGAVAASASNLNSILFNSNSLVCRFLLDIYLSLISRNTPLTHFWTHDATRLHSRRQEGSSSMMDVDYVPKSVPSAGKIRMRARRERINAIELGSSCSGCRHAAGRQCAGQPRLRDLWPSRSVGGIAPWTENGVLSRAMVLSRAACDDCCQCAQCRLLLSTETIPPC
jgi:hypothetical protein